MDNKKKERLPSRTVHLDQQNYDRLVRIAQSEERPYSVVVARALRLYEEQTKNQ